MATPVDPVFTDEQIAWLDKKYPQRVPDRRDTERDIWFKAGQVDVVEHLKAKAKQAERQK